MRRWSRAGVVTAAWVLATLQLPAGAAFTKHSYNITALPETCSYLRKDLGTKHFAYQAGWSSTSSIPDGCTLEISDVYMEGTCPFHRKEYWDSCASAGRSMGGSNASCEMALRFGASWSETQAPYSDVLCAASSIGYFYVHNSCNQTFSFVASVNIQSYSSCQVHEQVAEQVHKQVSLSGVILAFLLEFLVLYIIILIAVKIDEHRQRLSKENSSRPPAAVQLAPVGADEAPPDAEPATEHTPLLIESAPPTPRAHSLPAAQQPPSGLAD